MSRALPSPPRTARARDLWTGLQRAVRDPRNSRLQFPCLLATVLSMALWLLFLPHGPGFPLELSVGPFGRVAWFLLRPAWYATAAVALLLISERAVAFRTKALAALIVVMPVLGPLFLPRYNPLRNETASAYASLFFLLLSGFPLYVAAVSAWSSARARPRSGRPPSLPEIERTAALLRKRRSLPATGLAAVLAFAALAMLFLPSTPARWLTATGFACIFFLALMVATILAIALLNLRAGYAAEDFGDAAGLHSARVRDPQAVGALVDIMESADESARRAAVASLTRLLPRLKATDAPLLDESRRAVLYSHLRPEPAREEPGFAVSILKVLEQVGDAAALPLVERLAREEPREMAAVRAAARACLPFLRERAARERDSRTLLRPARGVAEGDADRLLRPTAPEATPPAGQAGAPASKHPSRRRHARKG